MCFRVYFVHMILTYFIWMYQEQLVFPGMSGLNDTTRESEIVSFTERYLTRLARRKLDLKKLLMQYSSVCPIQRSCGVYFEEKYLFTDDIFFGIPAFSECNYCGCSRSCIDYGNCCPGTHFGYVSHECVNTILYPKSKATAYYMVGTCFDNYIENSTVKELCESKIHPCTSFASGLIYKSQYCAQCNSESECTHWKLNVDCVNEQLFRERLNSFSDMKAALNQSDCVVQYKFPIGTSLGHHCNGNAYLNKVRINRCNVTGLWRQFDADIDWACENYISPYKAFKNIFCYICNPSHANSQSVSIIDSCDTQVKTPEFFNLYNACSSFQASDRLKPFKNIYCYACNNGQSLSKRSEVAVFYASDLYEQVDHESLSTQIDISLIFPQESNVEDVKQFVQGELHDAFEVEEITSEPSRITKTNYNDSTFDKIIKHYITVCGKETLCMYNDTTDNVYGNPVCGHCKCESDCAENEICCPDTLFSVQPFSCLKPERLPKLQKRFTETLKSHDKGMSENKTYKIIDKCLNQSHELSHKCSSVRGDSDFLADIPISTHGAIPYRNIYCYVCNNINRKDIILKFQAYCETYIEYDLFTNLSELLHAVLLYCHSLSFVPARSKACVDEYDAMQASFVGGEKYERIEVPPSDLEQRVIRYIKVWVKDLTIPVKEVYSSCDISGYLKDFDILVDNVCEEESVTLLSLPEYRIENRVYKNFACFLCNPDFHVLNTDTQTVISECRLNSSVEWFERNDNLEDLCSTTQKYDIWLPYKNMYCAECNLPPLQLVDVVLSIYDEFSMPYYKHLFSISPEDFARLDATLTEDNEPSCIDGTYDYNLEECRSLYCNTGYQLYNSSCKPIFESAFNHVYEVSLQLRVKELDGLKENIAISFNIDFTDLCSHFNQLLTKPFRETTEFYIQQQNCQSSSVCSTFQNSTYTGQILDITHAEYINVSLVVAIQYTDSITAVRTTLVNALNQTFFIKDIRDTGGNSHSIVLHTVEASNVEWLDLGYTCVVRTFRLMEVNNLYISYFKVDKYLLCAYVKMNFSEVNFYLDTLVVSIRDKNVTFSDSEYKVVGNDTIICIDDFIKKTQTTLDKSPLRLSDNLTDTLNIFTLFCTVISLTCLFLTFTTYCLFSALRTVPGRSLMLLCFALFSSQTFLQFGITTSVKTLCIFIGVCIHYFWIAFFCAMNICSFHMFKLFYFYELTGNERRLFIRYLLYFTFFPLALVMVTILISVLKSDASGIGYGANYCFISDFYIFVGTFLTPACLIFLSNFIFFSLAFHKIRTSPSVRSTQDKNTFFIFLKLCTIVGVTWPLLIVDNMLDISWFSFVVSGINSLQGVFIFGSFVLTRRVLSLYKSAVMTTSDKEPDTRTTAHTSQSDINKTNEI